MYNYGTMFHLCNENFKVHNVELKNSPIYFQFITTYFDTDETYNDSSYTEIWNKIWKKYFNYAGFKTIDEYYDLITNEEEEEEYYTYNDELYNNLNNIKKPYEIQEYLELKYQKILEKYKKKLEISETKYENIFQKLMINNVLKSFDINYCMNFFDGEKFYCLFPNTVEKKYMIITEKTLENYKVDKLKEWSNETYIKKYNYEMTKSYAKFYNRIIKYTHNKKLIAFGNIDNKYIQFILKYISLYDKHKHMFDLIDENNNERDSKSNSEDNESVFININFIDYFNINYINDNLIRKDFNNNNFKDHNFVQIYSSSLIKKFNGRTKFISGQLSDLSNNDAELLINYIRPIIKMTYLGVPFIIH